MAGVWRAGGGGGAAGDRFTGVAIWLAALWQYWDLTLPKYW
jgi:hypothetical protein